MPDHSIGAALQTLGYHTVDQSAQAALTYNDYQLYIGQQGCCLFESSI